MTQSTNKLAELLVLAENPSAFKVGVKEISDIQLEHLHLKGMLERGVRIYGVNTAVGHRDSFILDEKQSLWTQIVDSHLIGKGDAYNKFQARCIGLAKIMQWRAGRSGVSPELFQHVANVIADLDFSPSIPSGQSYSSGDVIPATHWAVAVLKGGKGVSAFSGPAEAMPLINGSFVHVGLAAASLPSFDKGFDLWLISTRKILTSACRNNSVIYSFNCDAEKSNLRWMPSFDLNELALLGAQDSVAVRASLDVAEVLMQNRENLDLKLNAALSSPSSNPLIDLRLNFPISQASFLEPALVIAQSAFIESILLAMWTSVSRIQYLLSGLLPNIPMDGGGSGLGIIQRPKQMLAILEHARLKAGRRVFSSGGSASNGIEDLWTNGVFVSELIDDLCLMFQDCCEVEAGVLSAVL